MKFIMLNPNWREDSNTPSIYVNADQIRAILRSANNKYTKVVIDNSYYYDVVEKPQEIFDKIKIALDI